MKLLKKFFKLTAKDKLLFIEALILLYCAKSMLMMFTYKFCIKTINSSRNDRKVDIYYLRNIKRAIRRANQLTYWKNVCLVQSFAASWMLSRRNIKSEFIIGVNYDFNRKLIAHAWIVVNDYEVVPQGAEYMKLAQH